MAARPAAVLATTLLCLCTPAAANTVCSPGMLRNAYGIVASGTTASGITCQTVGIATFTSNSRLKVKFNRLCADGSGGTLSGEGTFDVDEDCTATAQVTFSSGTVGTYRIVIVDGGNQFLFTASVPGIVFSGQGVKT